jgi:hypothetical protein
MDTSDVFNTERLDIPDTIVCGGYDRGRNNPQEQICHDLKIPCGTAKKVHDFEYLRENKDEIQKFTCPTGYRPVDGGLTMDGKWLKPAGFIKGKGYVDVTNAPCKGKKDRYYLGCTKIPNYFTGEDDIAACYSGLQDRTITQKIRSTNSASKPYLAIAKSSLCNNVNNDTKNTFFDSYCKNDLAHSTGKYCEQWWAKQTDKKIRDDTMRKLCAMPVNKDNPICACINAPHRAGITDSVRWAYHSPCSSGGYRTQEMYNITLQECNANMNINAMDGNSLDRIKIKQNCMQLAGANVGDINAGLNGDDIGPNAGSNMNSVDTSKADSTLDIGSGSSSNKSSTGGSGSAGNTGPTDPAVPITSAASFYLVIGLILLVIVLTYLKRKRKQNAAPQPQQGYYQPQQGYYQPQPIYAQPQPVYAQPQ